MASADTEEKKTFFIWNDLTNTLDFIGKNATEDSKSKKKKKTPNIDSRGPPNYGGMGIGLSPYNLPYSAGGIGGMTSVKGGPKTIVTLGGSPKIQMPMKYSTGGTVHLMDVKRVALDNLVVAKQTIAATKQKNKYGRRKFEDEYADENQTDNLSLYFKGSYSEQSPKKTRQRTEKLIRAEKRSTSGFNDKPENAKKAKKTYQSIFVRHLKDTPEFDHFLISLLQYFTCFFDQLEQELRPHKTSFLEPSKAELQALSETKKKMEITRRKLGQSYCVLILGLGIEKQHHMGCGKKRVSSTHRDKKMFEDLYLFCTYVVYVTFRYKEWDRVSIELGNMLRSEVFNPALQKKHKASVTAEVKENNPEKSKTGPIEIKTTAPGKKKAGEKSVIKRCKDLLEVKLPKMEKLTPAQHRRKTGKRPAIRTAIYQRSTALVSLLPLPKEESEYLFQSKKEKLEKEFKSDDVEFSMDDIASQKIGIIGEQMDLFNMNDLTPKTQENEDENDSADDGEARDRDSLMQSDHNLGRQTDVISRVTTAEEK